MKITQHVFRKLFFVLVFSIFFSAVLVSSTNAALYKSLGIGSRGQQVTELQQVLINLGLLKGAATGYYGNLTRLAVIQFQKLYNISPTGYVGPITRNKINQIASSKPSSKPPVTTTPSIKISKLPVGFRSQGAPYDVKTVKLLRKTVEKQGNFFSSIFQSAFAQEAADTRLVVYLVPNLSSPGQYRFFNYSLLDGKSAQLIDGSFSSPIEFTLSPRGFLVFYSGNTLYKFNIDNRSLETINTAGDCGEKGCGSNSYDGPYPPSVSPDGSNVAYFRGSYLIVRSLVENKPASYAVPENTLKNDAVWSDDGRFIYVKTVRSVGGFGMNDILEINLSTSETRFVTTGDTAKHQVSFFGADEKSQTFLYVGETFGGAINRFLVKHNTATGPRQYSGITDFLQGYVWTPDRTKLYFTQGGGIRGLDLSSGQISDVLMSVKSPYVRLVGFGRNDQELIVSDGATSGGSRIVSYYSYDLQTKSLNELFQFAEPTEKGY